MSQVHHDPPDDRWEPAQPVSAASSQDEDGGYPRPYAGVPHGSAPPRDAAGTTARTGDAHVGGPAQRYSAEQGSPTPTSAVVLLVLSGLGLIVLGWTGLGLGWVAPVVLAIIAMSTRQDPALSRRLTKIGWIVYAVLAVLTVAIISLGVAFVVWFANADPVGTTGYDPGTIALTAAWLGAR